MVRIRHVWSSGGEKENGRMAEATRLFRRQMGYHKCCVQEMECERVRALSEIMIIQFVLRTSSFLLAECLLKVTCRTFFAFDDTLEYPDGNERGLAICGKSLPMVAWLTILHLLSSNPTIHLNPDLLAPLEFETKKMASLKTVVRHTPLRLITKLTCPSYKSSFSP